ncbi:MAG: hypothetical protein AAF696_05425 [Bacteroidota bacterium]
MKFFFSFGISLILLTPSIIAQKSLSYAIGSKGLVIYPQGFETFNGNYEVFNGRAIPGLEVSFAPTFSLFNSNRLDLELSVSLSSTPLFVSERTIQNKGFSGSYSISQIDSRKFISQIEGAPRIILDLSPNRAIRRRRAHQLELLIGTRIGLFGLVSGKEIYSAQDFFADNPDGSQNPVSEKQERTEKVNRWGSSLYGWLEIGMRRKIYASRKSYDSLEARLGISFSNFEESTTQLETYLVGIIYVHKWKW